jgi:hypothetical protein
MDKQDNEIKIYPLLMMSAFTSGHGGAARLYAVARNLDKSGSGYVYKEKMLQHLLDLQIHERNIRRWWMDANELGIFRESTLGKTKLEVVFYVSPDKLANLICSRHIGNPVLVREEKLFSCGWRAWVWNAFLCSVEGEMLSKQLKFSLTGIHPRVQAKYEEKLNLTKIRNDAFICKGGDEHAKLLRETSHNYLYSKNGRIFQRFPDIICSKEPIDSRTCKRGRTRKYQKKLVNLSLYSEREQGNKLKKFYSSDTRAYKTIKKYIQEGYLIPGDIFDYFVFTNNDGNRNTWKACHYIVS